MWSKLNQHHQDGSFVELRRERFEHTVRGFITGISAELIVVALVDSDCNFGGVTIFECEDVSMIRWGNHKLENFGRVVAESPSSPEFVKNLDLASWDAVVRELAQREKLLTIYRERTNGDVCFIGTNVVCDGETIEAEEVTTDGAVEGKFVLALDDTTRIEFGGGYERALWRSIQLGR